MVLINFARPFLFAWYKPAFGILLILRTSPGAQTMTDKDSKELIEFYSPDPEQLIESVIHEHMTEVEKEICNALNASGPSSLLEPPETTLPNDSDGTYRGRFMAGKEKEYLATLEAYLEIYRDKPNTHVGAIRECRTHATFQRDSATGDVQVFGDSCRDRWCVMCCAQKQAFAKDQAAMYISSLKAPRFLTLTLKNNESDLKSQVTFLQQSFSKLRNRAYWKKNVTGGIWFLEVKRGKNSEQWHPHLHILLDGNYMEQGRLSALWELVTFGSPIIYITRISDKEHAAKYVAKYSAKPAVLKNMPLEDRMETITALFRKRLCGTFGTAKCVTLTPPKIESGIEWDYIGHHDDIVKKAATNEAARAVLVAYNNYEPLSEIDYEKFTGHVPGFVSMMTKPKKVERQLFLDIYNTTRRESAHWEITKSIY
jgi:hypothetical protein